MKAVLVLLSLCAGLCLALPHTLQDTSYHPFFPSRQAFQEWLGARSEPIESSDSPMTAASKIVTALLALKREREAEMGVPLAAQETGKGGRTRSGAAADTKLWSFIPYHIGNLIPDGDEISWEGICHKDSKAKATTKSDGTVEIELSLEKRASVTCGDLFAIATVEQFGLHEHVIGGTKKMTWKLGSDASDAVKWDLATKGIRIFMFAEGMDGTTQAVLDTAELFEPIATKAVGALAAEKNVAFLETFAGRKMTKRTTTDVHLNASEIHSGDFFGVIRLDGLDPMLGWAMGSTTGHTTVALWDEDDGQLYVCESTATTSYWDVNGLQKTPYEEWLVKAKAASFNVVHLPLAPKYRDAFNVTAAWEFFRGVEGFDYGYKNMLWGWVDTVKDNYPCVLPDYDRCLSWDLIEVMFPEISGYVAQFETFYDQAWNHRLNVTGLPLPELLQLAHSKGINASAIPAMVEQDSWQYNTTRYGKEAMGPAYVCCVFVCHMWKAAGLFKEIDDEVNCVELTNWDDYVLTLFDSNYQRPQACVDADPDNAVCQLLGDYTLTVNNYNSKPMYRHMAERCPSLAPNYDKPDNC